MSAPTSWNRLPRVAPDEIYTVLSRFDEPPSALPRPFSVYGNGRSYGDVCLTEKGSLLLTKGLDRFISFDAATGVLRCEAGVTLESILSLCIPQGWFLPVTPGTQLATVGGAVANDVHGKNHHVQGSFGHHVRALELWRSDGQAIICQPGDCWFASTVGGLGLTGLIRWVELQLLPVVNQWMWVEAKRFTSIDEFWLLNKAAESDFDYTVAWVDCLAKPPKKGRGLLFCANHASELEVLPAFTKSKKSIPFETPVSLVNSLSLRAFNQVYYHQPLKEERFLQHYVPYFYPLDAIQNWNRIYGTKGFYQYQCVIPPESSEAAISALLDVISMRSQGSFLAVLKAFGQKKSVGMLSFARAGATLALDFPNRGSSTRALLNELDSIVKDAGGALYPAKDARMSADMFQSSFPEWEAFSNYVDPHFSSRFWRRVT